MIKSLFRWFLRSLYKKSSDTFIVSLLVCRADKPSMEGISCLEQDTAYYPLNRLALIVVRLRYPPMEIEELVFGSIPCFKLHS